MRELLLAGRRQVRELWLADSQDSLGLNTEIEALAGSRGVVVRYVGMARLRSAARTEAPQGVLAIAEPLVAATLDELAANQSGMSTRPFVIVLDGVTDPQNVGAVMRVAECAGASGVVLPRHRSSHITPSAAKAAAGAVERLRIALVAGVPSALTSLSKLGFWSVGLAVDGGTDFFGLDLRDTALALVLGSEGKGLTRLARQRCDVLARLPLAGAVGSLNVSAAAAVASYEVLRQRSHH